ncbi:hypothetical protein BH23PLA1_BH23PLA1_36970 [soil metagenome]
MLRPPRALGFAACLGLTLALVSNLLADDAEGPSVGVPARINQLVLPGTELEAMPLEDRALPIVLRIAEVFPHGDAFRYDLIYYGLEPGAFDLRDYLLRKDGSSTADLPPIPVTVHSILPPGQIEPNRLEPEGSPFLGGYRAFLIALGVVWTLGVLVFLWKGQQKQIQARAIEAAKPMTLADRLRPLVEQALAGALDKGKQAELERLLIGYWRRRLGLEATEPAEMIAILRRHEEAGPLLLSLEDWLHRPNPRQDVDIPRLLDPYRNLPADALQPEPEPSGRLA